MQQFVYPQSKNQERMTLDTAEDTLRKLAAYLDREHKKGKIPLVIAGAGVSTRHLEYIDTSGNKYFYDRGLPSLGAMIQKIQELVDVSRESSQEMETLRLLFREINPDSAQSKRLELFDREWIGKLFVTLSDSRDSAAHGIWQKFCHWFFFECCENEGQISGGALNINTSQATQEIAKMYESLDAICLSANFDDFLEYALSGTSGTSRGISLFSKKYVDSYFQRNRRGTSPFSNPPHNRCVLHANGDVLWLHCSGDKDEGYCPNRGKYFPAFYDRRHGRTDDILQCQICGSRMEPTMTMPGTYQKDYNTRQIISSIWEYLAPKLSCVITVGVSCNWDDVLLKFILGLLIEREIPHLDINDFSDSTSTEDTAIERQIVRERRFQSRSIQADARDGLKKFNDILNEIQETSIPSERDPVSVTEELPSFFDELVHLLEEYEEIQHLKCISQLGLKPLSSKNSTTDNDRWRHSQQVAKNAYQLYHRLCRNSRKQETRFEQVLLCTAGLLHDCGHLPFSHLLEDVFGELSWSISDDGTSFKHDQYSRVLIRRFCQGENSPLKCFLGRYGVTPEDVILLIEGNYGIGYLDTLINSAVDADKIAYIFADAKQMKRALMLEEKEFIEKLTEKAYITQEGLVALESTSAWYALRLLDERKRMYDELYLNSQVRCMEAAAKYIITTYFVQKYNQVEFFGSQPPYEGEGISDLGGYRIMLAIEDMIRMRDEANYVVEDLSPSVGMRTRQSLRRCMEIVLMNTISDEKSLLEEQMLLNCMYHQLTGEDWKQSQPAHPETNDPYQDDQIQNMADRLSYRRLADVRKRIILNYPGLVLVDLHKPIHYYSTPSSRQSHYRLDGTNCVQDTILLPDSKRSTWHDAGCRASIPLSEYVRRYERGTEQRPVFQVFKIGDNQTDCEHAVDMLKKELQKQLPRKEDVL